MAWPPSENMLDALAGAIVGGLLTGIGGFGGILYARWLEGKRLEREFQAAVLIVLDELGANEINMQSLIGKMAGSPEIYDSTYRSVELVLAGRMRPRDRQLLAEAYAPLRARWVAEIKRGTISATGRETTWIEPNQSAIAAAAQKIRMARSVLAGYVPKDATQTQANLDND